MPAAKGTSPDPATFLKNLRLLGSLSFSVVFQLFSAGLIGGFSYFLLLFPASPYFWGEGAHDYPMSKLVWIGVHFLLAGGAFALPWLGFWWMLYGLAENGRIRLFPLHLLSSYLPLIGVFLLINPVYYPDAMIPSSAGEMTFFICMAMSAVLLFPFYSIGVYRFVLRPSTKPRKFYRFLLLCSVFAALGLLLLPLLWQLAPCIYPGLSNFPAQ